MKVISRVLGPKKIGVRIYKKFEERFQSNNKIINAMFEKIPKKNLDKYSYIVFKKIKNIFKKTTNNPDFFSKKALTKQKKFENKEDLLKYFGWKVEKKICTIFSPNMIDGNFYHEMKLFPDIQTWLEETLKIIKKSEQNINFLIRPHPSESYFPKLITKSENIFKEIIGQHPYIKLCPNDCSPATVKELTKIGITSHGSVGVEYPSFGIPVVIAGDSFYSGNGFNIEPQNIKDYIKTIKNLDKFINKSLNNNQIKLARALYYLHQFVIQMDCPLLDAKFDISDKKNFDNFISDANKLRKKYDIKKDNFFKKFNYQVINNNSYLIND